MPTRCRTMGPLASAANAAKPANCRVELAQQPQAAASLARGTINSTPFKVSSITRAPSAFVSPCLPTVAERPPSGPGWMHEIKHDGYRLQVHIRDGRVRLFTRTGVDWSDRYPWIVEDAARLPVRHAIIDAECCCAGDDGITDFDALHSRVNDDAAFAYAFDLLLVDGDDIRRAPLAERRDRLAKLLRKAKPGAGQHQRSPKQGL